jgi:regulator of RNase E activity RraA
MLVGINTPIRIGNATAMPGDVVLGGSEGVIFIPAHLARKLVDTTELVRLKDEFRAICYQKKTYPLESLYGTEWTEEIERGYEEFVKELDRKGRLTPYQRKMLLK